MTNLVQDFMNSVRWYQPTTDTDDWRYFNAVCKSIDYRNGNPETLKSVAWKMQNMKPGLDTGMWQAWQSNFTEFLTRNMALSDDTTTSNLAIQYAFIGCFKNNYGSASHNNDLWQSFNDQSNKYLKQDFPIPPTDFTEPDVGIGFSPKWLLAAIPAYIFTAIKSVEVAYYRPTVDTDTWAYYQNVVLNMTLLDKAYLALNSTYLLTNISSPVDAGVWGAVASATTAFVNANLGLQPNTTQAQVKLAVGFCESVVAFDYEHAAHNKDLFQAYSTAFRNAATKIRLLLPQPVA